MKKTIIRWICGIWALGLGLRMSFELILCENHIIVPKNNINIFFDFIPLCILGFMVTAIETVKIIKKFRNNSLLEEGK